MTQTTNEWVKLCNKDDLTPDTGICALAQDQQIAIFWVKQSDQLYAISNFDPIGKANVISRGIIGSLKDEIVVSSPLYKQHYNLLTGQCLEVPEHQLATYPVRVLEQAVQIQLPTG